ncbi:unnamed protein product [Cuscuta campestris]|uniref:Uncharacterized protein n=1 Tax=Cuscuta campestris TaxID=132261 RepID=A0A484KNZ5_9ASTE|nr:unnamed protein product [Cuscuta campestris]
MLAGGGVGGLECPMAAIFSHLLQIPIHNVHLRELRLQLHQRLLEMVVVQPPEHLHPFSPAAVLRPRNAGNHQVHRPGTYEPLELFLDRETRSRKRSIWDPSEFPAISRA